MSGSYDRWKSILFLFLPNRWMKFFPPSFEIRNIMHEVVAECQKSNKICYLLYFDIKGSSVLKRLYGEEIMQRLDREIEKIFRKTVLKFIDKNELLLINRVHGDDYIIFIKKNETSSFEKLQAILNNIKNEVETELMQTQTFIDSPIKFHTGFSAIEPNHNKRLGPLISEAIQDARIVAKEKLNTDISNIRNKLTEIIRDGDIKILTQPIISFQTGEIEGWEVLTRGPVNTPFHSPLSLFTMAHHANMLVELELLVLSKAVEEVIRKKVTSRIFINVTPISLKNPYYFKRLVRLIEGANHNIRPEQIVLEVTERHSIDDYDELEKMLKNYRQYGFQIAVDDTGAGYASLNMITQLMPDIIKIDRSVIDQIDKNSIKESMLQALLYVAKKIRCKVVAEGIETEMEANVLMKHQVDFGQGYYFAKPESPFSTDLSGKIKVSGEWGAYQ